jgi:integrase
LEAGHGHEHEPNHPRDQEGSLMPSVWIREDTRGKSKRFVVQYRPGGREERARHGGSFKTRRLATVRAGAIETALADLRLPELRLTVDEAPLAPTVAEALDRWLAGRIDISEDTRKRHVSELGRIKGRPIGRKRVDELTWQDVADWIAELARDYKRGSIRKTKQTLAMALDHEGVQPNPVRDKRVKLPREEEVELNPPTADHVLEVYRRLPEVHREALLFLDASGARVGTIDTTKVGDYDQPRRRVRLRNKGGGLYWHELHPALADTIEARLPHPRFRDPEARLFAGSSSTALRTAIAKACKAAAIPTFSPHDLRHRRISLLHLGGMPWARIGATVGQRDLKVTADIYTHVLSDEREVDYRELLEAAG